MNNQDFDRYSLDHDAGKPRNKRRFDGKSVRREPPRPEREDRIRSRRRMDVDDDFLDDDPVFLADDLDDEDLDDFEDDLEDELDDEFEGDFDDDFDDDFKAGFDFGDYDGR